jgi:threonine/homoserine/homoserine lactone efflux protein
MLDSHMFSANFAVACSAYFIGVASPGPSNLAIMGTAMAHGRKRALALAAGVISGSLLWGILAAFGLASLMRSYSAALIVIKVVGGVYLLWLSWKAARTACSTKPFDARATAPEAEGYRRSFVRGAAMHITNPKAIFVWLSMVSLALPPSAGTGDAMIVVASCGMIGAVVFGTYAIAFSTLTVRRAYHAIHRWFNATLACVFAYAGFRMLLSNQSR